MKKSIHRIIAFLLVGMLILAFVGCGTSQDKTAGGDNQDKNGDGKDKGEIRLGIYVDLNDKEDSYAAAVAEMVKEFEEETGIKVKPELVPWDQLDSKLIISNNGGNPVDVSYMSAQKLGSLVNAGALKALDDYIAQDYTEEELEDFSPAEKAATTSALDGKKYAMLLSIHSRLIFVNTNIIPEDRIPKTWDELIEIGKEVTKPDENVWAFLPAMAKHYGNVEQTVAPFIWSAGGRIADDNGNLVVNSPEALEAIEFLSDMVNVHKITPEAAYTVDGSQIRDMFAGGNIGMTIDNPAMMTIWRDTDFAKEGKLKWAPIPYKEKSQNFVNGFGLAIPSKAKNPDGAWKFIEFISRPENQIRHSLAEGGAPIRISSRDNEAYDTDWWKFVFENMDENGRAMDPLVYYQEGLDAVITAAVSYFMNPDQDLQKLMDDAVNNFNNKYSNK